MVEFWKKLGLFLGWGVPPGEVEPAANEAPGAGGVPPAFWAIGFDSVLPGMQGRLAVPVGPGRSLVIPFRALTVSEAFGVLGHLSEVREQWPFGLGAESFAGYVALEGPGWDLTVFFSKPSPVVEYHGAKATGGTQVSGEAGWYVVAQALVLCPDYDAVVGYLTMNPYRAGYVA